MIKNISWAALCWLLFDLSAIQAAEPQWIWSSPNAATAAEAGECAFRKAFKVDGAPATAFLEIAADNRYELFLNGRRLGAGEVWQERSRFDIRPLLIPGMNLVAVRAVNDGPDPAGLMVRLEVKPQWSDLTLFSSDASWKVSTKPEPGWQRAEFNDSKWSPAAPLGEYGKIQPWGAPGKVVVGEASQLVKPRNTKQGLFEFESEETLVLLGGTFIERMQSNSQFELALQNATPQKNIRVRNLGWSGDNVWGDSRAVFGQRADGFKRLLNDVHLCKPTTILLCYGENEAFAGEPGLLDFQTGFETLLDNLEQTGARLLIAAPRKHESIGTPFPNMDKYNASLKVYCNAMQEIAKARQHTFIDWYDLLPSEKLTVNGVHWADDGYARAAPELVESLGVNCGYSQQIVASAKNNTYSTQGVLITDLQLTTTEFKAAFRFEQHRAGQLRISGLSPGQYSVTSNTETPTTIHVQQDLEMVLAHAKGDAVLRKLIFEKDFLFFNRYRPQNETYLFLFRKHEQGNNAVEIPQFDPLIADLEKQISDLKKPATRTLEIRKTTP
jgi:lysophospholipase L1-like esterase